MPLPTEVVLWTGRVPEQNANWKAVKKLLTREPGIARPSSDEPISQWSERFRQGATIVPRLLFFIKRMPNGPLGMTAGQARILSLRRNNDKKPWKDLPLLEGVIETEFIRPVLVGESVLPYRIAETFEAIIPRDYQGLMDGQSDRLIAYKRLRTWWPKAEAVWEEHRSSEKLTLIQQLNYQKKLENQFPIQSERIVYNRSGTHLVTSRVKNSRMVVDFTLYWATAATTAEAHYLCAILNSATITVLARPLMS